MTQVRTVLLGVVLLAAACTTPPRHASGTTEDAKERKELGARIEHICSLPANQRAAEIKKLEAESGMVLYCGK